MPQPPVGARSCRLEDAMAFKPNYRQQRSERTRAKDEKKQAKLAKREADAARRRAERDGTAHDEPGADRGVDDAAADRGAEDQALAERETDDSKADAQDPGAGLERTRD